MGLREILLAATTLASKKIGALVVIERDIGLRNYVESGIALDVMLTYDLLVTIFSPNTPLHDGAVIVQHNGIIAAGCFLPLTLDPYLSKELGTRHRAAIGITEETDAMAIIVSEETGTISLALGERSPAISTAPLSETPFKMQLKATRLTHPSHFQDKRREAV